MHILETGLNRRRFLAGETLTVADILAGHTLSWAKSARLQIPADLERYLASLLARDAVKRADARINAVVGAVDSSETAPELLVRGSE